MAGIEDLYPQFAEFARRSMRNLGMGATWVGSSLPTVVGNMALENAQSNNAAIKAGAASTQKLMAGGDMTPADLDALHASPAMGFGTDAGGGGAFAGTYVGRKAAQVPQRYREFAEKAAQRGMDPEAIRAKYGWFQDPSGDWKFEISDHGARIVQGKDGTWKLIHPELRRQYPDMVDTLKIKPFENDPLGSGVGTLGTFDAATNTARLNADLLAGKLAHKGVDYEPLRVLLHELQHGIQRHEGHSPGTNPWSSQIGHLEDTEYWPERARLGEELENIRNERTSWFNQEGNQFRTLEEFDQQFPDWRARHDAAIRAWVEHPDIADWKFQKYGTALGEVEARDTMHRAHMTPEQRKAYRPYWGEAVPIDQIWDVREVEKAMYPPRKAADVPDEPPTLRALITRHLGLSPE